jgi:hypothetical protein
VDVTKSVRLELFFERLLKAQPASSHDEAFELLATILNQIENEMTTIPFNPSTWETDGRMYPPQSDSLRDVPNFPNVKRYRSIGHNTYIADNGAIEITTVTTDKEESIFSKVGSDGKPVRRK